MTRGAGPAVASGMTTATPLGPRGATILLAVSLAGTAAYVGYAATRTPAVVIARDADGGGTFTRERWVGAPSTRSVGAIEALRMERTSRTGCRAVLRTASGELAIGRWGRRAGCAHAGFYVDEAARAIAAAGPFRARIPVTGSQVWWPLPVLIAYLFAVERQRRAAAALSA